MYNHTRLDSFEEAHDTHLFEAAFFKWTRNIVAAGGVTCAVLVNVVHKMPTIEHLELTGGSLGVALLGGAICELARRGSQSQTRVDERVARIEAANQNLPVPEWATATN